METLLRLRRLMSKQINKKVKVAHQDSDIVLLSYSCNNKHDKEKFSYEISESNCEVRFSARCYLDMSQNTESFSANEKMKKIKFDNIKIQNEEMEKLRIIVGRYGISSVFGNFKPQRKSGKGGNESTYSLCMKWSDGDSAVVDSIGSASGVLKSFFEGLTKRVMGCL